MQSYCVKIEVPLSARSEEFRFLRDDNGKVRRFSSLGEVRKHLESWKSKKRGFYYPAKVYRIEKSLRNLILVATYFTPFLSTEPVWKEVK